MLIDTKQIQCTNFLICREVLRLFRFPAVFGAVGGLAWYMIYDGILCTHGQATLTKHLIAYGIAGGIVVGTLYNPASAFYGSILGTFWGLIKSGNNLPVLPANANFKFEDFDK